MVRNSSPRQGLPQIFLSWQRKQTKFSFKCMIRMRVGCNGTLLTLHGARLFKIPGIFSWLLGWSLNSPIWKKCLILVELCPLHPGELFMIYSSFTEPPTNALCSIVFSLLSHPHLSSPTESLLVMRNPVYHPSWNWMSAHIALLDFDVHMVILCASLYHLLAKRRGHIPMLNQRRDLSEHLLRTVCTCSYHGPSTALVLPTVWWGRR